MTEILFTGKSKDSGEWVYGALSWRKLTDDITIFYIMQKTLVYQVIPESIGQYIGRVDDHGHPIFVGQIIEVASQYSSQKSRYAVVWNEKYLSFGLVDKDPNNGWNYNQPIWGFSSDEYTKMKSEIIGNIIDHPELLKNKRFKPKKEYIATLGGKEQCVKF